MKGKYTPGRASYKIWFVAIWASCWGWGRSLKLFPRCLQYFTGELTNTHGHTSLEGAPGKKFRHFWKGTPPTFGLWFCFRLVKLIARPPAAAKFQRILFCQLSEQQCNIESFQSFRLKYVGNGFFRSTCFWLWFWLEKKQNISSPPGSQ